VISNHTKNQSKRLLNNHGTTFNVIFCLFNGKKRNLKKDKNQSTNIQKVISNSLVNKHEKVNASRISHGKLIYNNDTYKNNCVVIKNIGKNEETSRRNAKNTKAPSGKSTLTLLARLSDLKLSITKIFNHSRLLLILSNDIESNPGPKHITNDNFIDPNNMFICSYNVKGLGGFKKLKRVINQLLKLPFKNNSIINLQETHITNENSLSYHWKHGIVTSAGTTASAGVAILYNSSYFDDIIDTYADTDGRICSLTAAKDGEIYSFFNIYAPNDHYQSLDFFINVKRLIMSEIDKHP
jgi:hypothetical protein